MTAGELADQLKSIPRETLIVLDDGDGFYSRVLVDQTKIKHWKILPGIEQPDNDDTELKSVLRFSPK
jgi:hypothetical protein